VFEIVDSPLPGVLEMRPIVRRDKRGRLVKIFQAEFFARRGLATDFVEEYYSVSRQGVLRGLHFQLPPHDHDKLVYCPAGRVLDAVLDLRVGSPAFGRHALFELSAEAANQIYIPAGAAHGFYTLSQEATLVYNVTTVYAPQHDAGLLWSSAGIDWPDQAPLISERDAALPPLSEFVSPFVYKSS